ncbi:MAG: patatin-like phospholipase family protein [Hyphomicrobiaceae bacterium]|nr:patatin-like phospholipase family protein [Hyphomicrobiaceae bacterium]
MAQPKIGVAFGGGAARGWAHIGVLRALLDAGIRPDIVAGTSIGAVVGGCYVADRLEALEEFALGLTRRKVFGYFDFNLSGSGLISGQRLSKVLEGELGDVQIQETGRPFTAVATEIGTGHEVWLSRGRMVDAIRASYAIPGVFKPVRIDGRWLFDGALVNPIPITVCRAMGAQYVIAINLNADLFGLGTVLADIEARSEAGSGDDEAAVPPASNGWGARQLLQSQLFGRGNRSAASAPSISAVMIDAFNIVHDRIARSRLAGDPPDVMISPRLSGFGLFDFHRASELVDRGRQATERVLSDVKGDIDDAAPQPRPTVLASPSAPS